MDIESSCSATGLSITTTSSGSIPIIDTASVIVPTAPNAQELMSRTSESRISSKIPQAVNKKSHVSSELNKADKLCSVLVDLEAQMEQHKFYDLDRELEQLNEHTAFRLLPMEASLPINYPSNLS